MAASIDGVLEETLQKRINSCKLLVVGAGGIGCELIKNLVLTGFHNVELVSTRVANPSIRFVWHPSAGGVALRFNLQSSIFNGFDPKRHLPYWACA